MTKRFGSLLAACVFASTFLPAVHAEGDAATAVETPTTPSQQAADSLFRNSDAELDVNGDGWPEGWPRLSNATWLEENGNHFVRIESTEPGKMLMLRQILPIPSGVDALSLRWKQRISNLKPGAQPWFDARILIEFQDADGKKISGSPGAPYSRKDTEGWVEKTKDFLVPEGAASVVIMPTLFQVKSGIFDLDDLQVVPIDAAQLIAKKQEADRVAAKNVVVSEEPNRDKWPKEIHVVGNRLQDAEGNDVWLQGVHVPSLEWSEKGESVLKSIKVATEDWKANVIRLSIKPDYWMSTKGNAQAYQALVDAAIVMAANRGAYTLIDNHTYRAPRESDIPFWKEVAEKYKNNPAVLFDIMNEPHSISWDVWKNGGFVEERKKGADEDAFLGADELQKSKQGYQSPGMQKMVEVIRETGAKNVLVIGGLDWAYDLSGVVNGYALNDPSGNGIMYSTHIYPWKKGWQTKVLDAAAKYPIFVGELGANTKKMTWMPASNQEDAATWVPDMLGLIQKYHLNWSAFSFHPKAAPVLLLDWDYTPTPEWGVPAKEALSGKQFELKKLR